MSSTADAPAVAARSARGRNDRRPKFTLDETDAERLAKAAKAKGIKRAVFVREAVLAALKASETGADAVKDAPQNSASVHAALQPFAALAAKPKDPNATVPKKLFLTPEESALLHKETRLAQMQQRDYLRLSVVAALVNAAPPKRKASISRSDLAHEISLISFQLKKLGTNLNQLAKQANHGLVPITDAEIRYFNNYHQRVMTLATTALERVLA